MRGVTRGLPIVVIGGGFYGLSIAIYLREKLKLENIVVLEKEESLMSRASYVNQARVHNGYHYPRSVLTAYRSAANFPRFVKEHKQAVVSNFDKYYATSRVLSKVNAAQFKKFCEKIGAEIDDAPAEVDGLFNKQLTEKVFKVKEYAFNSWVLRDSLIAKTKQLGGISIHTNEQVQFIEKMQSGDVTVKTTNRSYTASSVLNCTYSQINLLHRKSDLPLIPVKHEITEMCLVKLPDSLKNFSITMMDGPFFSIMPFPSRGLHTLSHVRYTPHQSWIDDHETDKSLQDTHKYFSSYPLKTNFKKMYADVVRYIPSLKNMELAESISEVKTVLIKSEGDDSRPILFKPHFGMKNYTCIMGGKLDNIYDVFQELRTLYA